MNSTRATREIDARGTIIFSNRTKMTAGIIMLSAALRSWNPCAATMELICKEGYKGLRVGRQKVQREMNWNFTISDNSI